MHFRSNCCFIAVLLTLSACASGKKHLVDYDTESKVRIPIRVANFTNKSARTEDINCKGWYWFSSDLGEAFQELAIDELTNYKRFTVMENYARYAVAGTVNSFEYCSGRNRFNAGTSLISDSFLGAGLNDESATVEVTLRLIDTRTGRVISSHKGKGQQSRTSLFTDIEMKGFRTNYGNYSQTSLSAAIQDAIQNAIQGLIQKANL